MNTNFHFNCSHAAFEEGLDMLAQFFISPLFKEKTINRVVGSLDQEFRESIKNDAWHY